MEARMSARSASAPAVDILGVEMDCSEKTWLAAI